MQMRIVESLAPVRRGVGLIGLMLTVALSAPPVEAHNERGMPDGPSREEVISAASGWQSALLPPAWRDPRRQQFLQTLTNGANQVASQFKKSLERYSLRQDELMAPLYGDERGTALLFANPITVLAGDHAQQQRTLFPWIVAWPTSSRRLVDLAAGGTVSCGGANSNELALDGLAPFVERLTPFFVLTVPEHFQASREAAVQDRHLRRADLPETTYSGKRVRIETPGLESVDLFTPAERGGAYRVTVLRAARPGQQASVHLSYAKRAGRMRPALAPFHLPIK